jgi:hypothetical protein
MVICFVPKFFFRTTRVRILFFFYRAKREIFFRSLTLGYMTNTLKQIIFFSSTKIRIFFLATLGIRIFFFRKSSTLSIIYMLPSPHISQPYNNVGFTILSNRFSWQFIEILQNLIHCFCTFMNSKHLWFIKVTMFC